MTAQRRTDTPANGEPLWRADARERLAALLPELAVSVVAFSCLTVVMGYSDRTGVLALVPGAVAIQVLVQVIMYCSTYLSANFRFVSVGWMFAILGAYGLGFEFAVLEPFGATSSALQFFPMMGAMLGIMFFCLTRVRWLFVTLVLETLVLADAVSDQGALLMVHLVGVCALAALFVMRSSATRITMAERAGELAVTARGDGREERAKRLHGWVALLAVAVASACFVVALVGSPALWRGEDTSSPAASASSTTAQPQPSAGSGQGTNASAAQGEASTASQGGVQAGTSPAQAARRGVPWALVAMLVVALALVPFAARALRLALLRSQIAHEPTAADQAARLYVATIGRLDALGIVRDEASTPSEFMVEHAEELEAIGAAVGFDADAWEVLTDAYERARYAGLDPTPAELQTCWQLYDALPAYARTTLGWRRYLAGPFWRL